MTWLQYHHVFTIYQDFVTRIIKTALSLLNSRLGVNMLINLIKERAGDEAGAAK